MSLSEETWKDIPGYEGFYQVSSMGKVRRVAGTVTRQHRGKEVTQPIREKVLSATGALYPMVNLCRNGKCTSTYVHHLVAGAFLGDRPPEAKQICHRDGDHWNPKAANLRYDTPTGNALDRHAHGTDAVGANNPRAIFTENQVRDIKAQLKTKTAAQIARELGRPQSTIRGIRNKAWKHL